MTSSLRFSVPNEDWTTSGALRQGVNPLRTHKFSPLDGVQMLVKPDLVNGCGGKEKIGDG